MADAAHDVLTVAAPSLPPMMCCSAQLAEVCEKVLALEEKLTDWSCQKVVQNHRKWELEQYTALEACRAEGRAMVALEEKKLRRCGVFWHMFAGFPFRTTPRQSALRPRGVPCVSIVSLLSLPPNLLCRRHMVPLDCGGTQRRRVVPLSSYEMAVPSIRRRRHFSTAALRAGRCYPRRRLHDRPPDRSAR
jgi:hypothetical protein